MESLLRAERLLAQQMGDAPKELRITISLAMNALKQNNLGDALNLLNRAHDLVEKNKFDDWKAELAAAWAVYYFRAGNAGQMHKAIQYAKRREPNSKRIAALLKVLESK